jgi:pyruvate dehydrogenase E1 component
MKKLTKKDLKEFRDRLFLPISDEDIDASELAPFYHPGPDSPEIQYMLERRRQLGGPLPERRVTAPALKLPGDEMYAELKRGSGKQAIATTMAFVRLLRDLMKDPEIGHRFVPIAPDEFRTFGMDSMFPTAKIYSPHGQRYESVDRKMLLTYKESEQGQMLHEGISELGAMGSTIAAGTSYATHGEPMIPVYIFYSMFGFQRTGDWMYALGDMLGRGFLIGATSGRTTLTGEGLQHADGHSPLIAATNPACVYYDPAFAYEISHIMQDGLRRMYGSSDEHPHGEDVFFYLSVYNEPTVQLPEPDGVDAEGILRGIHLAKPGEAADDDRPAVQLLASGVAAPWAIKAQQLLADDWGVKADVWSVTSWNELAREALTTDSWNLLHPEDEPRTPYITEKLADASGPALAVSDYMRAVPDQIAQWVPTDWHSLGTDGFGFADTRAAARRFFRVDAESIVVAALEALAQRGEVDRSKAGEALAKYRIDDPTAVAGVMQEGAGA